MADHAASDEDISLTADPPTPAQPQPVIDQARISAAILACTGAVLTIAQALQWVDAGQADTLQSATSAGATAVLTIVAIVVPVWRARRARDQVTPTAAPVSADGEQLVTLSTARVMVAAALDEADTVLEGEPVPTPWGEDDTVERAA